MLGAGAAFSSVLTAYRYTNGLRGIASSETDEEEVERRENAKKFRRRPLSETIEQMGEGRGRHLHILFEWVSIDFDRNLCARLRRAKATEANGQVRRRCEGPDGGELDADVSKNGPLSEKNCFKALRLMYIYYPMPCLACETSSTLPIPPFSIEIRSRKKVQVARIQHIPNAR
jgi:hypothetical protein